MVLTSQVQAVHGDLHAVLLDDASLWRILEQDWIGVVDVGVDRALDGEPGQPRETAIGAVDRHVSHLTRRLAGQTEPDQLVVPPAGSVDEQAGAVIQLVAHRRQVLH
jgi:hypothetical protein